MCSCPNQSVQECVTMERISDATVIRKWRQTASRAAGGDATNILDDPLNHSNAELANN